MPNATRIVRASTKTENHEPQQKHAKAFLVSIAQLFRHPLTNLVAILIIAIALSLPTVLFVLLKNLHSISNNWEKGAQISLYIKPNVSLKKIEDLSATLKNNKDIIAVKYVSPEEGLKEFQKNSNFGDILAELNENPLPAVLIVEPKLSLNTEAALAALVASLKKLHEVAAVQLDYEWVTRLTYFANLGTHVLSAIFILLSVGLILIISNTISLTTHFALHKITGAKPYSGDRTFLYRVFLYKGFWFGIFGSLVAWLLVELFLWWLRAPVNTLATSYGSTFMLQKLSWESIAALLAIGISLGIIGAWFGIKKHAN